MVRGFMHQAVHPMDAASPATSMRQPTLAGGLSDGDGPGISPSASASGGAALKPSERGESEPAKASPSGLMTAGSHRKVNGSTDTGGALEEDLDEAPAGVNEPTKAPSPQQPQAKVGRQLTFADESGEPLSEITFSNRTHYSKQPAAGAAGGSVRACCVVQ